MTGIAFTGDGKVIFRWREKTGVKSEEFLDPEPKEWVETPAISVGKMDDNIDKYN